MPIDLSVVMPVYNERHLVAECIRRVMAVESPLIGRLDLIVVDDGSTDGSQEVLRKVTGEYSDRVTYVEHPRNQGKGAAVRSGIAHATGDVTVVQDADLEYNPQDLPRLMVPFLEEQADAVFGSRFLPFEYRRVLYYRHTLGNRLLTTVSNLLTDLNLSDMETCYKAVRTPLLKSIPLRSRDFRIEPELTFKLAKRRARIFEVPISYAGRTYEEGKKIAFRDALLALGAMLRFWVIDDIYADDEYGGRILQEMAGAPKVNAWMGDTMRPYLGNRVLELGAGIGNMTAQMIPRDRYTVSDINPDHLRYLQSYAIGKPYLDVRHLDVTRAEDFEPLKGQYDTVLCVNMLEHVDDDAGALRSIRSVLEPGGRLVLLVPQDPRLFGTLDEAVSHYRRYTRDSLRQVVEREGFEIETLFDYNRTTVPGWWLNGRVLRRRHFSRVQLKIVNTFTWLIRRLDGILPWQGVSLIAVARKR
jgi:SAM-dependent methyltransferase